MSDSPPKIGQTAPGLIWRKRKNEWVAVWLCRTDKANAGFVPRAVPLWHGDEPTTDDAAYISQECNRLQSEMLAFGKVDVGPFHEFDGTLEGLAQAYQTDPDSNFTTLRWGTRQYYIQLLALILREHGEESLADIRAREIKSWHRTWTERGVSIAGAKIGMLRTIVNFGAIYLEDKECERLAAILHGMRFKVGRPRNERLTADQATAIRHFARKAGLRSIAYAQAFQFDCTFRQKDVIGEHVPISEPGLSDVTYEGKKWLRGIRWEEIDANLILRHTTSKRLKDIEIDLKLAPMVIEELEADYGSLLATNPVTGGIEVLRFMLPASGPIIVFEVTLRPFFTNVFRNNWRKMANAVGIPKTVRNMDSRAGAISEATDAGAALEDVRHAATHSNITQTQNYSRGSTDKIAGVMKLRAEHRIKK